MNKTLKLFLPLLVITLISSVPFARAEYNVTVGATYNYDVIASNWTIKSGANIGSSSGYAFEDTNIPITTPFSVEVIDTDPTYVDWTMSVGTKSQNGTNDMWDLFGTILLLFLPIFLAEGIGPWNQTEIELGPAIMAFFFIEPISFSELFFQLANATFIESEFSDEEWSFSNIGGYFDNSSAIATFDWIIKGSYLVTASNTDYSGTYRWKIAYDKATGAVKGFHIDLDYDGTVKGTSMGIKLVQHFEQVGYDLPAFHFGGGFIPGFEWFIAFPALALLGGTVILIRKRK